VKRAWRRSVPAAAGQCGHSARRGPGAGLGDGRGFWQNGPRIEDMTREAPDGRRILPGAAREGRRVTGRDDENEDVPVQAVLWDMDGTLADSEPLHRRSFAVTMRAFGVEPPEDFHQGIVGRPESEGHAWLCRVTGMTAGFEEFTARRYDYYMANLHEVGFRPEAREVWDGYVARGLPQAIVSNSDRLLLDANIRQLGLSRPRLISVSRNDVLRGKPDPEPYLRAAQLLGVPPGAVAVYEDSTTGVRAGLEAGMQVWHLPEGAGVVPRRVRRA
jgi:beta-phosphoglucomutase-like phosphatase (HAD superfamily)